MKILMVSMPSIHFSRWVSQLKDTEHEVFWFDSTGSGINYETLDWITQITDWKLRFDFWGRNFVKKHFKTLYKWIQKVNERSIASSYEKVLKQVNPDIVHSFVLYASCAPIYEVMKRHHQVKWVYSSWGSDLFYFQNVPSYLADIKRILPQIDYMFADCQRDFEIAKNYGFKGEFLGVYPGGGGYDLTTMTDKRIPFENRNIILIKGYQGRSGRALQVLQAIELLKEELKDFELVVFGAAKEVQAYFKSNELNSRANVKVHGMLPHKEIIVLMGSALIYIGNSNSDGMPNTLLEAIVMGAFPIQSNPGGASAEVISNGSNGLLIENCESIDEIKALLLKAIINKEMLKNGNLINEKIGLNFAYKKIRTSVLNAYNRIEA
jgi:glycosyltransferase involved in cell wall biosynthesis